MTSRVEFFADSHSGLEEDEIDAIENGRTVFYKDKMYEDELAPDFTFLHPGIFEIVS